MQILTPKRTKERVGFLVPRWACHPLSEGQGVPYRALTVAGALHQADYEVVWFDQEPDLERSDRAPELRDALRQVEVVFLWMAELTPLTQTHNTVRLARMVKEWYPGITIVVGGEFITVCPPETLDVEPPIDFFLRGYGEEACVAFMSARRGESRIENVPGLVWHDGAPRANQLARNRKFRSDHLDVYRELDLSGYVQRAGGIFGNGEDTLVIGTSRGCPKRCAFCYWSKHEPSMVGAEDIVELVVDLRARYGVRQYHIAELDFATNRKRVLRMAELWRERVPDCTWFALMSPVDAIRFSDSEWDLLAASGCRKVEFGTESGSERMLQSIGKRHAPDDAIDLSRKLLARGIMPMHNFVFGLHGETEADRVATLQLIRRLQSLPHAEWILFTFRLYEPAWGTVMGDRAIGAMPDYPATVKQMLDYRVIVGEETAHAMKWLSAADERRIKRMVFHYLPLTTSKLVFTDAARRHLHTLLRALARLRLRFACFAFGVDRWMYRRLLVGTLNKTYRV